MFDCDDVPNLNALCWIACGSYYRAAERHACRVLLMVRGTYRYHGHRKPWTELQMRIREIAPKQSVPWVPQDPRAVEPRGLEVDKYLVSGCTRKKVWR